MAISHIILLAGVITSAFADISGCPGALFITSGSAKSCCVGGTVQTPYLSTCPGWPICKGPATTTTTHTPMSCVTAIAVDDPNYSSIVQEASKSMAAGQTQAQTTLDQGGAQPGATATSPSGAQPSGSSSSSAASTVDVQKTLALTLGTVVSSVLLVAIAL